MQKNKRVTIAPEACILGGLFLLLVPLPWLAAWIVAAVVHELGHIVFIRLCGGTIQHFRLSLGGALLEVTGMSYGRELLCSLAGPIFGLLLVGLLHRFPRLAICALVQSAYNLLPVFPLDGGRALRSLLSRFVPLSIALTSSRVVSVATITGLFLLGLVLVRRIGQLALLVPMCLLLRYLYRSE